MKMTKMKTQSYEVEIPETLEDFKNWRFSSRTTTGKDFKRFCRVYKKFIKENLPENAELIDFRKGHYILSGFIEKDDNFVYFSVSDVRYFQNEWAESILVRTAESEKDYSGGSNHSVGLEHFGEKVGKLLK